GGLQGRVGFVDPKALQIGFAPGGFQRWDWRRGGSRRRLSRCPGDGDRNDGADRRPGNGEGYHQPCEPVAHDGLLLPGGALLERDSLMKRNWRGWYYLSACADSPIMRAPFQNKRLRPCQHHLRFAVTGRTHTWLLRLPSECYP